jgi:hypothetical protein
MLIEWSGDHISAEKNLRLSFQPDPSILNGGTTTLNLCGAKNRKPYRAHQRRHGVTKDVSPTK